ncbi:MAG: hypothetical protein EPN60_01245 [Nevskiaceae bacterium]|nr:MAG: hypothetical protein EPO48_05615 [Nevskiaceae bacterium]TAM33467.1 MAG: hypothetical protein EPN60_01245 [Nevskiaceae bacterium]
MRLPKLIVLTLLGLNVLPLASAADGPASCSTEQAEINRLKARVLELEKALRSPAPPEAVSVSTGTAATGLAPKPANKIVVVEEEPYSRSGCRPSLFQDVPYAKWMDPELWMELDKGMSPAEVEGLLGPEHYDTAGGGNVKWEYGKCGARARAQLLFEQGKLSDWRLPGK